MKRQSFCSAYPDALVKAGTGNKPSIRAELDVIYKLLMACMEICLQHIVNIFLQPQTCHSGYRGLFAAWFPEEKCEVIAARYQHLLTHHLLEDLHRDWIELVSGDLHNIIVASLSICFGLFCRQQRVVGNHFGVLGIKSSGPHHIVGVQRQHIHPMTMALQGPAEGSI